MKALFAAGRQADALREFQAYRPSLADETGLEPVRRAAGARASIVVGDVPAAGGRPRSLRGYTVHGVIGEGAFGRVLAATQPGTNREVAIKVIRPDLADDSRFVQRFEAEAQLVARLEHPHIVPLYDYWREPGGAYLVFRLLTGGTAQAALVSGGAFDVGRVSRLVEEVGARCWRHTPPAWSTVTSSRPTSCSSGGNSYLTDFGIARSAIDDARDPVLADIRCFGLHGLGAPRRPAPRGLGLASLADRIGAPGHGDRRSDRPGDRARPGTTVRVDGRLIVAWRAASVAPRAC